MLALRRMLLTCIVPLAFVLLAACGAPSAQVLEATIAAAVQATTQAADVATVVQATRVAETACDVQVLATYAATMRTEIQAFRQQATLVSSTPRVGLGMPLQRLLDIQTQTRKLVPPACVSGFHERVVGMMELHQMAYQNVAGQGDETLTTGLLTLADKEYSDVIADLTYIEAGTVPHTVRFVLTPTRS